MTIPTFDGTLEAWCIVVSAFVVCSIMLWLAIRFASAHLQIMAGLVMTLATIWIFTPAQAQDALGDMARELVDTAQERGRSAEDSLRDWLSKASQISEAHREDARSLAATNEARIAEGMRLVRDMDGTFGDAARTSVEASEDPDGVIYVAVSLTMPAQALKQLSDDAHKVGAKLVIRGLVDGSFERTMVEARRVFGQEAASGIAIEPQVFRAYGIERVPTFIAAQSPVEPCETGIDCVSVATPSDRVAGNVSLAEALRTIAQRGDAAPEVARAALARLDG